MADLNNPKRFVLVKVCSDAEGDSCEHGDPVYLQFLLTGPALATCQYANEAEAREIARRV